jgi:hypothetical protein
MENNPEIVTVFHENIGELMQTSFVFNLNIIILAIILLLSFFMLSFLLSMFYHPFVLSYIPIFVVFHVKVKLNYFMGGGGALGQARVELEMSIAIDQQI